MDTTLLKTSVDDLYDLVKLRKKISVEEAAKILKISPDVVQSLVDFLVEEKIFGMEYKFTTPYVYLSQKDESKIDLQKKLGKKVVSKDEFFQKASKWNMPSEKVNELWKRYVKENFNSIKEDFYIKANAKNIPKEEIDKLWKKYLVYLQ